VLLDRPRMFNHARGLWGYTGTASDGEPLTIQATGLGGASAAVITAELVALGLRRFVRVGTARTLHGGPAAGDAFAVTGALAGDGPSRALGAVATALPDPELTARLQAATGAAGIVASGDLAWPAATAIDAWAQAGAIACDLQTATVLQVARNAGLHAAAVLVLVGAVTDPGGATHDLDDEVLLVAVTDAAHAAAAALGLPPRTRPPLPPPRDDERVTA
jgi:uridine phosphorylase